MRGLYHSLTANGSVPWSPVDGDNITCGTGNGEAVRGSGCVRDDIYCTTVYLPTLLVYQDDRPLSIRMIGNFVVEATFCCR